MNIRLRQCQRITAVSKCCVIHKCWNGRDFEGSHCDVTVVYLPPLANSQGRGTEVKRASGFAVADMNSTMRSPLACWAKDTWPRDIHCYFQQRTKDLLISTVISSKGHKTSWYPLLFPAQDVRSLEIHCYFQHRTKDLLISTVISSKGQYTSWHPLWQRTNWLRCRTAG
jgi:hypothetical protein